LKKVFLAIWIIITVVTSFSYDGYALNKSRTEENHSVSDQDQDDKGSQDIYHFQIDKTFSTTFHIDFHADFNFEFELPDILDSARDKGLLEQKEEKEYFKTLFHFIISPNAP